MKKETEPQECLPGREELLNTEMNLKDDKDFDAFPLPACYGNYGGGVMCLCCDMRHACARLTAGDRERI